MKEGLRSESQAEMGGAGLPAAAFAAKVEKSGKAHFSARLVFLPSFPLGREPWNAVKAGQSGSNRYQGSMESHRTGY
jgi:hypothetical protein